MGEQEQNDLDRIGLFKEMGYLHGVEYISGKTVFNEASHKGKQMLIGSTKPKSGTQDGYFDKEFPRIFEGEGYGDPIRMRRTFRLEQGKKNRPSIWKPTSPTKKPCGVGSYYGTFEAYQDEKTPAFSAERRTAAKVPCPGKNVLINPPKKGTGYGYPNVTISKMPPYFLEDDYERLKEEGRGGPKIPAATGKGVFVVGTREEEYFDKNPFHLDEPGYRPRGPIKPIAIPFVPTSPAKKDGGMKAGCFDKFPTYMSCPYTTAPAFGRSTKNVVNSSGKMFQPWHGVRVYPVRSIVNANVKKAVNSNNCETVKGVVYCKK